MARAAARLMAVVVFPTPPFWFAMAMTITGFRTPAILWDARAKGQAYCGVPRGEAQKVGVLRGRHGRCGTAQPLHLVLAELVFGEPLEPLLDAAEVHVLAARFAARALD